MESLIKVAPKWALAINEINTVGDLEKALGVIMQYVRHQEDVKNIVSELNECERLIEAAEFAEKARTTYAAIEASLYVEIVRKGWSESLGNGRTYKRQAAEWLASLDELHYEEALKLILENGQTMVSVWKAAVEEAKKEELLWDAIECKHDAISEYKEYGRVNIGHLEHAVEHKHQSDIEREINQSVVDSTRIALRKVGAIGIGDGVYSDPNRHPEDLAKGIRIRKGNLAACVCKLFLYCEKNPKEHPFRNEFADAIRMTDLPICASVLWDGTHDGDAFSDDKSIAGLTRNVLKDIIDLKGVYEVAGLKVAPSAAAKLRAAVEELVTV